MRCWGSAATRGRSPTATPGTFPLTDQAEAVLAVSCGASREGEHLPHHLFPCTGSGEQQGATEENRLLWMGFLGKWPRERALWVPPEQGA